MKIKLSFAVASLLALAVSSQAFAQDNSSQPSATGTPSAQQQDQQRNAAVVPGAKEATTQSTGELIPYAVAIGVVVLIAVASSGGGHKSGNTGTTP